MQGHDGEVHLVNRLSTFSDVRLAERCGQDQATISSSLETSCKPLFLDLIHITVRGMDLLPQLLNNSSAIYSRQPSGNMYGVPLLPCALAST